MSKYRYAVIDVGCIECGESTEVVGIFMSLDQANERVRIEAASLDKEIGLFHDKASFTYMTGGQHHVEVLPIGRTT